MAFLGLKPIVVLDNLVSNHNASKYWFNYVSRFSLSNQIAELLQGG